MSEGFNPYENQGQQVPAHTNHSGSYQSGSNESGGGYKNGGGNGYGNRSNSGGYSGGGGNRSYGGNKSYGGGGNRSYGGSGGSGNFSGAKSNGQGFQKREYTEEDIKSAKYNISVVISGNENINDKAALLVARLAKAFDDKGIVIRTGGMNGTDEIVCNSVSNPELHLPFKNFNKRQAPSQYSNEICTELARRQQPNLDSLQNVQKAILAKNPRLIFGRYLTSPAQLVIVWSEDGCELPREVTIRSGNAGHLAKIAAVSGIRVINIQRPDAEQRAMAFLESLNVQQEQPQQPAPANGPTGQQPPGNQYAPGQQPPGPNPVAEHQSSGYQQSNQQSGGYNGGNFGNNPSTPVAPGQQPGGQQPSGNGGYANYNY